MSDFATLRTDAVTFYDALAQNNKRDWWLENKATYDTKLKAPALALLDQLTPQISALAGASIKTKLFRPHRDVRFSKDKTPYNTHLHMMWQIEGDAPQNPVFFFGIGRDYVTAGVGMMGFDKPVLSNWRKMLDLDTDRILGIVEDATKQGFSLREPALKRVPSPYDKDHAAGHLLRMKGLVASRAITKDADLSDQIMAAFKTAWPINDLLISIAEA
jgi:uncharacterized protein (TIGR02453 family)